MKGPCSLLDLQVVIFKDIVKCAKELFGQIQPHFVKSFLRFFCAGFHTYFSLLFPGSDKVI